MYIVIAGAGLVGRGLAQRLVEARHDVVVVDADKAVCEELAARIGALVLHGAATNVDLLEQAGISKADVAVATMRNDADNLAFAVLAKSFDTPRVIARVRDPRYEAAYEKAGTATTIRVADVFVNQLLLYIDDPHLRQVASFGGGRASIVVDTVPEDSAVAGKTISQIAAEADFPSGCIITGIYRLKEQEFIIPRGSAQVRGGDHVFLVAEHADLRRASKLLHRRR